MIRYNPTEIEPKWQKIWADENRYQAKDNADNKFYISCMFPYPSGVGMHVGHAFEHVIIDAKARFERAHGRNVMNPMGWDSFGLPAENYAIKTGTPPGVSTKTNIENFIHQLKLLGLSLDWSREINTSSPEYYKWTQWIFTKFFERGLAYQKEANQWWCPKDKTVLANEQVVNGKCWRCESDVVKKPMKQWFFKITDYADALLEEIPNLDWPEKIKAAQTNWIGRSQGAEIDFDVNGLNEPIKVFSTRPDTIFGATFLVLAPEHPVVKYLVNDDTKSAVDQYISEAIKKSEIERMSEGKEKTGVFTGSYAINPASNEKIPIWVADYVLWGYGTGAVMAVPAHDERDYEFATKFDLSIIEVIEKPADCTDECYSGEGKLTNSGEYSRLESSQAREQIVSWLERSNMGRSQTTYKMRDWLVSRQRYWGSPIPIVHTENHGAIAVAESCLPVELPEIEDYQPSGKGTSVLADVEDWVNVWVNVKTGETLSINQAKPESEDWTAGKRETDTLDGYACSSWYLMRYTDPHNDKQAWSPDLANYWAPLDMYVGGDHAVAHLLYVRFWTHVFHDMGLTNFKEPVKKLVYHGLIQAEDGRKMSKSLGNVVDPLDVVNQGYGADALRTFELFLGPITDNSNWSSNGIAGVYRFLNRAWTLSQEFMAAEANHQLADDNSKELIALRHRTVKKVTDDIRRLSFNTAIAALMEYVNELYKMKEKGFSPEWREPIESLVQLLAPFAPHMCAELWQQLDKGSELDFVEWPSWDDEKTVTDVITVVVQINGKLRAKLEIAADATEDEVKQAALEHPHTIKFIHGRTPRKTIYVPGRLVNIVV